MDNTKTIDPRDLEMVTDMGLMDELLEMFGAPPEESEDALDYATHTLEEVFEELNECEGDADVAFNQTPVDELFHS